MAFAGAAIHCGAAGGERWPNPMTTPPPSGRRVRMNVARSNPPPTHDVLDDLNSYADHLREWVAKNPVPIIAGGVLVLGIAAAIGVTRWWEERSHDMAAAAFATIDREYRAAMGATPGSIEVPEPANPETARSTRMDFATRLLAAADEHAGSGIARAARLEAADLFSRAGAEDRAAEALKSAMDGLPDSDPVRGLLLRRSAVTHESAGRWSEAAADYLAASEIERFPLRVWSKADAARCLAEAGDAARAAELARSLESDATASTLPPHLVQILSGLRAAAPPSSSP